MTEIKIYSDEDVNEYASSKKLVILTHDADFLRIINQKRLSHSGIIFASQNKLSIGEIIRKTEFLVGVVSEEDMENHIEFL